jgi:CHAD domain-containing protein
MAGSPEPLPIKVVQLLDQLALQVRLTARASSAAQVHRLRVAIRRFRQALTVVEDQAEVSGIKTIHLNLKKIMALAGGVRDCDITVKLIRKGNAPARLLAHLQRRREDARRLLTPALHRWLDQEKHLKWRATLAGLSAKTPARRVMLDAAHRLFKRARKIKNSTRAMHKLRIAAKKLRYTMEVAGHADSTRLHRIKKLQKHLGAINDYAAALRIVDDAGGGKKISNHLKEAQRKEIQVYRQLWNDAFEGKETEWVRTLLHADK